MTQAAAAKTLGMSTVRLNELVRGKRGVTADTALRLAQFFKTTPQFWMHMPITCSSSIAELYPSVGLLSRWTSDFERASTQAA